MSKLTSYKANSLADIVLYIRGPPSEQVLWNLLLTVNPVFDALGVSFFIVLDLMLDRMFQFVYNVCKDEPGYSRAAKALKDRFDECIQNCDQFSLVDNDGFYQSVNYLFRMTYVATEFLNHRPLIQNLRAINSGICISRWNTNSSVANTILYNIEDHLQ